MNCIKRKSKFLSILDKMKSLILYLIFLSTYCYCEQLLGGWSTFDDDSLKSDCLNKALAHIYGAQVNDEIRSQASDVNCKSQIVNGLNIKCSFVSRGQKWQCSYYKSFIQTLETQLEQCKRLEDEPKKEEHAVEDQEVSNESEKEEQPLIEHENEEAEQPAPVPESDKEKQGAQEAPVANDQEEEEDDEAAVDAINRQMSGQFSNNEDEQKKK
jgi:hypothetical protein